MHRARETLKWAFNRDPTEVNPDTAVREGLGMGPRDVEVHHKARRGPQSTEGTLSLPLQLGDPEAGVTDPP